MRTWLLTLADSQVRRVATEALTAEGLNVTSTPHPDDPAVLVAQSNHRMREKIAELSAGGLRRLVVVLAGEPASDPWELLAAGAADVLEWGTDGVTALRAAAARVRRWFQVDRLARADPVTSRLVGESPAWLAALRWLVEIARFSDASVLITGESGTGKELAARLVHALHPTRGKGKFCGCSPGRRCVSSWAAGSWCLTRSRGWTGSTR